VRHLRSVAYSAELVQLNKHQIWGGAPKLDCYLNFSVVILVILYFSVLILSPPKTLCLFSGSPLRLRNDLYCVEWGVKLYSLTHSRGPDTQSSTVSQQKFLQDHFFCHCSLYSESIKQLMQAIQNIWSNTSAKGVLPQSITLLLAPSSFSMFTTHQCQEILEATFHYIQHDDCKPKTQVQSTKTKMVLVQLNSAAAIYVIPHACHLVTCSDSYIWQNLCWGNCKYVNKMNFIKWRTNRMLSWYINNNRLINFT